MIDLHCHILPGLDDGPRSMEETLRMVRCAAGDGVAAVVATPHTLNGAYLNPAREVRRCTEEVRKAISAGGIALDVLPGMEVCLLPDTYARIEAGEAGTINDTGKYILVEIPSRCLPHQVRDEVFHLKLKGITPVIAHPERNVEMHRDLNWIYELVDLGALCQVTSMSITGEFGRGARECAEKMLRSRLAHVIASDGHSSNGRPPLIAEAVELAAEILGSFDEAIHMVTTTPAAIVAGARVEIPEPIRRKKRSWF